MTVYHIQMDSSRNRVAPLSMVSLAAAGKSMRSQVH